MSFLWSIQLHWKKIGNVQDLFHIIYPYRSYYLMSYSSAWDLIKQSFASHLYTVCMWVCPTYPHAARKKVIACLRSMYDSLSLIQRLKDRSRHNINRGNGISVRWILSGFICWSTHESVGTLYTREIGENGLLRAYKGFLVKNEFINIPNYWKPLRDLLAIYRVFDLFFHFFFFFFFTWWQNNPFGKKRKAEWYCWII